MRISCEGQSYRWHHEVAARASTVKDTDVVADNDKSLPPAVALAPFHEMPMAKCIGQNILVDDENGILLVAAEVDTRTAAAVDGRDSLLVQVEDVDTLQDVAVASDDNYLHRKTRVVLMLEVSQDLHTSNTLDEE